MIAFLWASALALPTTIGQAPPAEPLPLGDKRFHYAVSKPGGGAPLHTRTLWIRSAGKSVTAQQIPLTGPAAEEPLANIVVRDVNFDGQPDLMVTSARGNVNSQYTYWLYEATTQRFVRNALLSKTLGGYSIAFDSTNQRITTASRYSCCEHETRVYVWQQGTLKLLTTRTSKKTAQP